jgi:hypothetical protein
MHMSKCQVTIAHEAIQGKELFLFGSGIRYK